MAKVNKVLYNVDQTSGDAALRTTAEERRMARKNVGLYEVIGQATTKDGEGHVIDQGIAPLGTNGLVPVEYLPSFIGSVVNGYYYNEAFYSDPAHTELITPTESSTYVDLTDPDQGRSYRWSDETGKYFLISDQNAFGIITDGTNTKYADRPIDTLNFVGGSGLEAEVSDNGHADTVAFSHTNSVTAKTNADSATESIVDGSATFDIPWIKYDAQGHITGTGSRTHKLNPGRGYGTCDDDGQQKTVTIANYELVTGGIVAIKFDKDVQANSTLNISSKGAKDIYNNGEKIGSGIILAGNTATFMYDGTRYQLLSVGDAGVKLFTAQYTTPDGKPTLTIAVNDYDTMKSRCTAGTLVILKYAVPTGTTEATDHCMYLSYRKSDELCFYGYDAKNDKFESCTFLDRSHLSQAIIYTAKAAEVHDHGNIKSTGVLQTDDVTIASGDKLVVTDATNGGKVARAAAMFDGTTTTKALTQKGTFESFAKSTDIADAISDLYVPASGTGAITGFGAGKTLASLTETDGKVSATFQNISITKSQVSDFVQAPGDTTKSIIKLFTIKIKKDTHVNFHVIISRSIPGVQAVSIDASCMLYFSSAQPTCKGWCTSVGENPHPTYEPPYWWYDAIYGNTLGARPLTTTSQDTRTYEVWIKCPSAANWYIRYSIEDGYSGEITNGNESIDNISLLDNFTPFGDALINIGNTATYNPYKTPSGTDRVTDLIEWTRKAYQSARPTYLLMPTDVSSMKKRQKVFHLSRYDTDRTYQELFTVRDRGDTGIIDLCVLDGTSSSATMTTKSWYLSDYKLTWLSSSTLDVNATSSNTATNAGYAEKIGTSSSYSQIGSADKPVYVDPSGVIQPCTNNNTSVSMDTVDDQSGSVMKILLSNHPYGGITSVETAVKYATNRDENKNSKWLTYKPSTNTIYANLDGQAKYAEALCHSDGTAREVGNVSTPVYFDSDGIPRECEENIYNVKYSNVSSNNRCILLSSPASPNSGSAYTVSYNSDLKYNASDGTISASISGNAATATNAANVQYAKKSSGQYMVLLAGHGTITEGSYNPVGYCTQLSLDVTNNLLNTNIVGSSGRVRYKTCNNGTVSDSDAGSVTIVKSTDGSIPSSGDYFVFV